MNKKDSKTAFIEKLSRREFAKTAVIGIAAAAPLVAVSAQTPTPTPPKESVAPPNPQTSPTPAVAAPSPVAVAFGAVAEARFGSMLTPEQLAKVKEDMVGNVRTAERLSAAKLQNGDEPDFVFAA